MLWSHIHAQITLDLTFNMFNETTTELYVWCKIARKLTANTVNLLHRLCTGVFYLAFLAEVASAKSSSSPSKKLKFRNTLIQEYTNSNPGWLVVKSFSAEYVTCLHTFCFYPITTKLEHTAVVTGQKRMLTLPNHLILALSF